MAGDEDIQALKSEFNHFVMMRQKLLSDAKYKGKYVAMKNGKILDVGDDEFQLAEKFSVTRPGEVILIKKVVAQDTPVDLYSLEVVKLNINMSIPGAL